MKKHKTMGSKDAAYATRNYLKPGHAIPMHYGTYPILSGKPKEYKKALGKSKTKVLELKPGQVVQF